MKTAFTCGFCALLLSLSGPPLVLATSSADPYEEVNNSWEEFRAVYTRILENYYADLDQNQIMRAAIDGMLEELDSYSQFYDDEGLRQLRQDTSGKFAGLGITVGIKDHYPVVIAPIEDTPAFRAGLLAGDLIVSIEGRDTFGLSLKEVVDILRGEPGSTVRIGVNRKGGPSARELSIEREVIKIKSVALAEEIRPGIGYISLRQTRFSEDTAVEVEKALKALKEKDVKGAILDLRGNPGGLLSQATRVADLFLPRDAPIVSIKERDGRGEGLKRAQKKSFLDNMPLVVLVDAGSASASEIVAGAIQDNDRGVIVGTTSFGKGSVQTIFDLHEANNTALKLTTALYYTPSGRSIHRESFANPGGLPFKIPFGEVELPVGQVLDLVLKAPDAIWAETALRARFELEESQVEKVLSTSLGELVGKIPQVEGENSAVDSLEEEAFYTLKERRVYGGGGIAPDIVVEPNRPPRYILELDRDRLFFDFVVDYVSRDSTLARSGVVPEVDEAMLSAFEVFTLNANSRFKSRQTGRRELDALRNLVEEMGWEKTLLTSLDSLGIGIEKEKLRGITAKLEPYVKAALKRELALRLVGRRASLLITLEEDAQLQEAIRLLKDTRRYKQVLQGGGAS